MRCFYFSIVLVVLASACASTRAPVTPAVNTSFTVQINQSFDSLPNYSRIYFQGGNQIPKGSLDRWTAYCRLHVFDPTKKADYLSKVEMGSFTISNVKTRFESSDSTGIGPGYHVSVGSGFSNLGAFKVIDRKRSGPPSYYLYRVEMKLDSPDQPDVQSLICSKKWGSRGIYYPSLNEIRQALGDLIHITPLSISTLN